MIFAIKFTNHNDGDITLDITRHVHKTDTSKAYVVSDMFGVKEQRDDDDDGGDGDLEAGAGGGNNDKLDDNDDDNDDDDEDCCSICLTEKKAVCLLPCRHFCVCEECFRHIDRCPHCRQVYSTYLVIK